MTASEQEADDLKGHSSTGFLNWWLHQLAGAGKNRLDEKWHVLALHDADITKIYRRRRQGAQELGELTVETSDKQRRRLLKKLPRKKRGSSFVLRLHPSMVLQKQLALPTSTRNFLDQVINNQMDRLTPWPTDQLVYDYKINEQSAEPEQIEVEITAMGRPDLDQALAQLERVPFHPNVVDVGESAEPDVQINLIRSKSDHAATPVRITKIALALLFFAATLIGLVGGWRAYETNQQLGEQHAQLELLRQRSGLHDRLKQSNEELAVRNARIIEMKNNTPASVLLLELLSKELPDAAYLTRFELQGAELRIMGKSTDSSMLIGMLEESPHFNEVRFAAPTTLDESSQLENFAIIAQVKTGKSQSDQ